MDTAAPKHLAWPLDQLQANPAFTPLHAMLAKTRWATFPTLPMWAALPDRPYTSMQKPVHFVDPSTLTRYYEEAIAQDGHVATRRDNWHDCFNAFAWFTYPKIKAALNALHIQAIRQQPSPAQRCPTRDAATLLDESGVLLPYCDKKLATALYTHDWQTLFQHQRHAWGHHIDALLIGHANFEKALMPYIGWTGKAWPIAVSPAFFTQTRAQQCQILDNMISRLITQNQFYSTRQLCPIPLLGIPGWWQAQDALFYRNQQYFRP